MSIKCFPLSSAAPNQDEAQCLFSRDYMEEELEDGAYSPRITQRRNWKMVPLFQGLHGGGTRKWCLFSKENTEEELKMVPIFQG